MKKPQLSTEYSSAWKRQWKLMLSFLTAFISTYAICWVIYPVAMDFFGVSPGADFCKGREEPCSRPDLFAFQISSWISQTFCGVMGFWTWFVTKKAHKCVPYSSEGRLYGYLEEAEIIAAVNFTYQLFNATFSLLTPEHSTWILYGHHISAAYACWLSLQYQYLHHYGVLFLGLSEFSSIFLVVVDLANYFPPVPGTFYGLAVDFCRPAFAAAFFFCRIVIWLKVSRQLWSDSFSVLKSGNSEKYRPGKAFGLYSYFFLNVILSTLQIFWAGIILQFALGMKE